MQSSLCFCPDAITGGNGANHDIFSFNPAPIAAAPALLGLLSF